METSGLVVAVQAGQAECPRCAGPTDVQKTRVRRVATCRLGPFTVRETVRACLSGCRRPSGHLVTLGSPAIADLVAPGAVYGYDVEVRVGWQRFVHHRQREETRTLLREEHGLILSTGEISNLANRFVGHLKRLHVSRAPALREALEQDGGYPLDASGEDGRGTLFVAYAGWRRWVLGSWTLTTERADLILPCLQEGLGLFETPCAIRRDLGRAKPQAALDLKAATGQATRSLACHLHFLKDIGKDLLEPAHKQRRELFRRHSVKAGLRTLVRDLGRHPGEELPDLRADVLIHVDKSSDHRLPDGRQGLTAVRSLARWTLDYQREGSGHGFPFERPYLALYHRCLALRRAADAFPEKAADGRRGRACPAPVGAHPRPDPPRGWVRPCVRHGAESVFGLRRNTHAPRTLVFRGKMFDQLRNTLRLTPAAGEANAGGIATPKAVKEIEKAELGLTRFAESLRSR